MAYAMQIRLDVDEFDADDEDRFRLTGRLRDTLLDLDVDSVERMFSGPAPEGSKGVELAEAGALLVTLAPPMLGLLVEVVRQWLGDRGKRSVKMTVAGDTLEVTGMSSECQRQLIESWIHQRQPSADAVT